jgi:antitoxin CptB
MTIAAPDAVLAGTAAVMLIRPAELPPAADPDGPAAVALRRLRWHARRGLLENDLMLERFFRHHAAGIDAEAIAALEQLLSLPDGQLLDLALRRAELEGDLDTAPLRHVLGLLRAA